MDTSTPAGWVVHFSTVPPSQRNAVAVHSSCRSQPANAEATTVIDIAMSRRCIALFRLPQPARAIPIRTKGVKRERLSGSIDCLSGNRMD
jgi:hypothetical protein